jgi:3-phenylpropionate/trans-cinnamate dioxygenase ferredoxin component
MADFKKVLTKADLPAGSGTVVEIDGTSIAVFNVDGAYHAIDNTCLHKGGPLGEGILEGSTVTCPWHGWEYDVKTGTGITNAQVKVKTYQVKVEGEDILVAL